ncbi:MAG: ferritin-like domain-containing protein [Chloroflexi bacterium]|nr:ferritin-like domain-containing protein [Chloroflexota bacterium]
MAVNQDTLHMLRTEPEPPADLDLSWLEPGTEWGIRAQPGRRGLTLDDINVGSYGEAPDESPTWTMRPRGAAAREAVPRTAYHLRDKADTWSQNASMLYEEALQRQWSSATDIPWETLKPLPDRVERAMCQFCTFLTEVEFIAGDVPSHWLPKISNEHYEVKLFLASQVMDEARHLDVFRKRALANGGGLLIASGNAGLRFVMDAKDFTEMSSILHVQGEGLIQSIFRMGEYIASNLAEKRMFRLAAQDESRHVAFGVMHMKYVLETQPWRREEIHGYLDYAEPALQGGSAGGLAGASPNFGTSLTELFAYRLGSQEEGVRMTQTAFQRQLREYMHRLDVAGLGERRERVGPQLKMALEAAEAL